MPDPDPDRPGPVRTFLRESARRRYLSCAGGNCTSATDAPMATAGWKRSTASASPSGRRSSSACWVRRAAARPRCCASWRDCCRPPAGISFSRAGRRASAWSSSRPTSCPGARCSRTSCCRSSWKESPRRTGAARPGAGRTGRLAGLRGQLAARPLRRHGPARGHRPRPGPRPRPAAAGRAFRLAGRPDPRTHGRASCCASGSRAARPC